MTRYAVAHGDRLTRKHRVRNVHHESTPGVMHAVVRTGLLAERYWRRKGVIFTRVHFWQRREETLPVSIGTRVAAPIVIG